MKKTRYKLGFGTNEIVEQTSFLVSSSIAYDLGEEPEAKRIASTIRLLCHDTRNSVSLFQHLEIKNVIPMLAIATFDIFAEENLLSKGSWRGALTRTHIYAGGVGNTIAKFVPTIGCSEGPDKKPKLDFAGELSFNEWWNQGVLCLPTAYLPNEHSHFDGPLIFSRKELILCIANKFGGAHLDALVKAKYYALTHLDLSLFDIYVKSDGNLHISVRSQSGDGSFPFEGELLQIENREELATVRAISHEIITSLSRLGTNDDAPLREQTKRYLDHLATQQQYNVPKEENVGSHKLHIPE